MICGLFTGGLSSQEAIYQYKKVKSKTVYKRGKTKFIELDSLILFDNGSFQRFYQLIDFDQISNIEFKGDWIIKNDSLTLDIRKEKSKLDASWTDKKYRCVFHMKKGKLIPDTYSEYNGQASQCFRKLKRIKK